MQEFQPHAHAVLAVDPGLRGSGVALVSGGQLVRAGYAPSAERTARGAAAWAAAAWAVAEWVWSRHLRFDLGLVENPEQYEGVGHKANREDITELTGVAGGVSVILSVKAPVTSVLPKQWKGQVPKDVHNSRVMARLSQAEQLVIEWPADSLKHNVIDAVGLALWKAGRMEAKRGWGQ